MTSDMYNEIASILENLPDDLPDHGTAVSGRFADAAELRARVQAYAESIQLEYASLTGHKIGGLDRIRVYDPANYVATLERELVEVWLSVPESLDLPFEQLAILTSGWHDRKVTVDRLKRRFKDRKLPAQLQAICDKHGSQVSIIKCNSLSGIRRVLRVARMSTQSQWAFNGRLIFTDAGDVVVNGKRGSMDEKADGKKRLRGNGAAVTVSTLRRVLMAYED